MIDPLVAMAMARQATWAPYCGAAPEPSELMSRWNLDPWLLGGLALCACLCVARKGQDRTRAFLAVGVLAIAFVSPLCALSSALFSGRVVHHALLMLFVAPLLAYSVRPRNRLGLAAATLLQAVLFWFWNAPAAYSWALTSDAAYWLMQATLLGSSISFWLAVRYASGLAASAALLVTMVQMGLLGALITFAAQPLFAPHMATTQAFGLTPLEDQQAAGLIMWAPMGGAYLLAALALVWRELGGRSTAQAAA